MLVPFPLGTQTCPERVPHLGLGVHPVQLTPETDRYTRVERRVQISHITCTGCAAGLPLHCQLPVDFLLRVKAWPQLRLVPNQLYYRNVTHLY